MLRHRISSLHVLDVDGDGFARVVELLPRPVEAAAVEEALVVEADDAAGLLHAVDEDHAGPLHADKHQLLARQLTQLHRLGLRALVTTNTSC